METGFRESAAGVDGAGDVGAVERAGGGERDERRASVVAVAILIGACSALSSSLFMTADYRVLAVPTKPASAGA